MFLVAVTTNCTPSDNAIRMAKVFVLVGLSNMTESVVSLSAQVLAFHFHPTEKILKGFCYDVP